VTGPTAEALSPDELDALRRDVLAASYLRGDFHLASLGRTPIYFDKYLVLTQPSILRRLAAALATLVEPSTDRLACAELGGVPLAAAVSLELGVPYVILRREPRADDDLEGELSPGDRVVLVEDVVATGQHALTYLHRLRQHGVTVPQVVCVLDREEGASKLLETADCQFAALFTVPEEMKLA
jgi:orotate phosphoribosyltransferase